MPINSINNYVKVFTSNFIDNEDKVAIFHLQEPKNVYYQAHSNNSAYSTFREQNAHYLEFYTNKMFNFEVYIVPVKSLIQAVITHYLSLTNLTQRSFRLFCVIDLMSLVVDVMAPNMASGMQLRPYVDDFLVNLDKYYEITIICPLNHAATSVVQQVIYDSILVRRPQWYILKIINCFILGRKKFRVFQPRFHRYLQKALNLKICKWFIHLRIGNNGKT